MDRDQIGHLNAQFCQLLDRPDERYVVCGVSMYLAWSSLCWPVLLSVFYQQGVLAFPKSTYVACLHLGMCVAFCMNHV